MDLSPSWPLMHCGNEIHDLHPPLEGASIYATRAGSPSILRLIPLPEKGLLGTVNLQI